MALSSQRTRFRKIGTAVRYDPGTIRAFIEKNTQLSIEDAKLMDNLKLNPVFNAEELMNQEFKPTQWLIDNLLPEGLTVLSGAPKIGKSFLSLELAVAVATQGPILGHCVSKARGVLILALEDGPSRLFNRMQSAKFTITEKLYFAVDWPAKNGPDRLREYLLADPEIDLVIIDT